MIVAPTKQILIGLAVLFGSLLLGGILGAVVPDSFAPNAAVFVSTIAGLVVGIVMAGEGFVRYQKSNRR